MRPLGFRESPEVVKVEAPAALMMGCWEKTQELSTTASTGNTKRVRNAKAISPPSLRELMAWECREISLIY